MLMYANEIENVNKDPPINLKLISFCVRGFPKLRSYSASEPRTKDSGIDSSQLDLSFSLKASR